LANGKCTRETGPVPVAARKLLNCLSSRTATGRFSAATATDKDVTADQGDKSRPALREGQGFYFIYPVRNNALLPYPVKRI